MTHASTGPAMMPPVDHGKAIGTEHAVGAVLVRNPVTKKSFIDFLFYREQTQNNNEIRISENAPEWLPLAQRQLAFRQFELILGYRQVMDNGEFRAFLGRRQLRLLGWLLLFFGFLLVLCRAPVNLLLLLGLLFFFLLFLQAELGFQLLNLT
jgi:hypothetical protein